MFERSFSGIAHNGKVLAKVAGKNGTLVQF